MYRHTWNMFVVCFQVGYVMCVLLAGTYKQKRYGKKEQKDLIVTTVLSMCEGILVFRFRKMWSAYFSRAITIPRRWSVL